MSVKDFINKEQDEHLLKTKEEYNKITSCDHKFEKHGLGFKCAGNCGYYTGTHSELNELIIKEGSELKMPEDSNDVLHIQTPINGDGLESVIQKHFGISDLSKFEISSRNIKVKCFHQDLDDPDNYEYFIIVTKK